MSCLYTPLLLASHGAHAHDATLGNTLRIQNIHPSSTFSRTFLYYIYFAIPKYTRSTTYYILVSIYLLHLARKSDKARAATTGKAEEDKDNPAIHKARTLRSDAGTPKLLL